MRRSAMVVLAALGAAAACARVMPPPGWKEDRQAPQLVSTTPAQLAVVPDFRGDVVFKFDERIGERGISDQLAVVSPDTGLPRVTRHGSEIHVRAREGWRPGVVYQIVLLPGMNDMFGNATREPAQVVFSTGPAIQSTVIAGMLVDRLTGKSAPDALVQAVHAAADSLTYTTASDTSGFFALRYLPPGQYRLRAYVDRNHDRHPQLREPQIENQADLAPGRDSVILTEPLALLAGDTTPARLTKAEYRDSLQVRGMFDDYLDPVRGLGGVAVTLVHLPDSVAVPVVGLYFPAQFDSLRQAADTSSAARRARAAARPDSIKRPLPTQEIVIVPGRPLARHNRYRLTMTGVANVNNLPGGGGSQAFSTPEEAKPPQPTGADTTRARARTPADTARARAPAADTSRARPGAAARDTTTRR